MALFVHLTPAKNVRHIHRVGIARTRRPAGDHPGGLYATPLVADYHITHQWLRELRRGGGTAFVAVHFRLPDDEPAWVGRYNQPHRWLTAAEAVGLFRGGDRLGWEVVVPRAVRPRELHAVRRVSPVVGWRFSPEAKGRPPFCGCRYCTRGEFGANKVRAWHARNPVASRRPLP